MNLKKGGEKTTQQETRGPRKMENKYGDHAHLGKPRTKQVPAAKRETKKKKNKRYDGNGKEKGDQKKKANESKKPRRD